MIKRYYFMAYTSGVMNGNCQQGFRAGSCKSWLPRPIQTLNAMLAGVEKDIGQRVTATSFYRVR